MYDQRLNIHLEKLNSRVGAPTSPEWHPKALGRQVLERSSVEIEAHCLTELCQWIWSFLRMSPGRESIKATLKKKNAPLTITVSYLNVLVETWENSTPSPKAESCAGLVIDLLLLATEDQKKRIRDAHDEFIGAYLLCNGTLAKDTVPILNCVESGVPEDIWSKSALYQTLKLNGVTKFGDAVKEIKDRYFSSRAL